MYATQVSIEYSKIKLSSDDHPYEVGRIIKALVDAVTTLLVPHHRIVFNKAAGAGAKERSLYAHFFDFKRIWLQN